MPSSTILLLEQDAQTADTVRSVLGKVGYAVTVSADADETLRLASDHALVIIGFLRGRRSAQDVCRAVRAEPALVNVPAMVIAQADDVEERVRFLEAGADDVIAKPFDARELEARVEALLVRFHRSIGEASSGGPGGARQVIVFFSPKGGVGTTTLAVNVALASAEGRPGRVVLLDLDLQWGQAATQLNLRPGLTVAELSRDEQAFREPDLLRTYLERHEPGLAVLCAPQRPELGELLRPDQVTGLVAGMRGLFDVIVIDAGSTLDERSLALFDAADAIVFTVSPEIAALKALHSLLETLSDTGSSGAKTSFVVNHVFAREMLKLRDIENTLAARVTMEIPFEPVLYLKAVNEGIPVVRGAPRSAPAERLRRLTAVLVGEAAAVSADGDTEGGRRLLGGLRRRG